jgi:hypothetical protein
VCLEHIIIFQSIFDSIGVGTHTCYADALPLEPFCHIIMCKRVNMVQIHMYVDGKMRPVETILEMGEGGLRRMMEGVNSSMIYLVYCENFCKYHNVPSVNNKFF